MSEAGNDNKTPSAERWGWVKTKLVPILGLLLVLGIVIGVFCLYRYYPEKVEGLEGFGYLGVFLISVLLNATLILPAGNFLVMATLGAALFPPFVGIIGGLGAAIGELTGYAAGYSGQAIIKKRQLYTRLEGWMKRWGSLTIFILSVAPLFFDVAGIAAGALRFPIWKYFIACWLGRTILYIAIAWAGAMGWEAVLGWLG
ncbi:MAG TPA: VTT domain-containing protein [Dehalococcoidia bacterium]|nr:VTT domain-containing protein [Dehalococcoidia bacterium]